MAGILDSKSRVLDAIVTKIGRSQIATGGLKIEFASLTDATTYYQADEVTGVDDANMRIYFEATGDKPQDFITFETDDSGNLMGYPTSQDMTIIGDEIFKDDSQSSDLNSLTFVTGSSDFASLAAGIMTGSIDNFKNNYIIGSTDGDEITDTRELNISPNSYSYLISNTFPFDGIPETAVANIDSVECLFLDKRLSHIPNYKFLPPLVTEPLKSSSGENIPFDLASEQARETSDNPVFLGSYSPLNEAQSEMTLDDLMLHLNGPGCEGIDPDAWRSIPTTSLPWTKGGINSDLGGSAGYSDSSTETSMTSIEVSRERSVMTFLDTSETNNIIMQIFEVDDNRLKFKKLDVIDFGEFTDETDEERPNKHVFFVGKVFLNSFNIPTFVNIFTVILD